MANSFANIMDGSCNFQLGASTCSDVSSVGERSMRLGYCLLELGINWDWALSLKSGLKLLDTSFICLCLEHKTAERHSVVLNANWIG